MIINKIRISEEHPMASGGTSWPLPNCDFNLNYTAGDNGYLVKAAQGLDSPDLKAVVEGFDSSGIPIYGSFPEDRVIDLRVGLVPGLNQSYSTLRDALYRYMSRNVRVSFMDGSTVLAYTTGYISKLPVLHFSNQPDISISIQCDFSDLIAPEAINIPFALLEVASPVLNYENGTAPAGLYLKFSLDSNHSNFSITNHAKTWYAGNVPVTTAFTVTYPFLTGDQVTISTTPDNKHLHLLRSAVTYDLVGYINAGAIWPRLYSGVNAFSWTLDAAWMTWISASYTPRFWGV